MSLMVSSFSGLIIMLLDINSSSPTQGLQLRLKPIGVIRVELIGTAKKFRFMYSQKGKARPHSPNLHIHVSVSYPYIPTFVRSTYSIVLQQNRRTDQGNI